MADEKVRTFKDTVDDVHVMSEDEINAWQNMSTQEQLEILERPKENQLSDVNFDDLLKDSVEAESSSNVVKKDTLLGTPFIIRHIKVNEGQFGPFVTLTCQLKDNSIVIVNDGSSGVAAQMSTLIKTYGLDKPILIKKGLRRSGYYVDNDTKKVVGKTPKPNSFQQFTYYLDI